MSTPRSVTMAFFELEGWERPILERRFSGHELVLYEDALSARMLPELERCAIVSPFIYSQLSAGVLAAMPALELVATRSTGFDHVDLAACRARGIRVANVPEYGSQTVAEHTFMLVLALSRKLITAFNAMRAAAATPGEGQRLRGFDLRGKTLGVVGAGNIGLHVVRMAKSFGVRVMVFDPKQHQTLADLLDFEYVSLDRLLTEADIVSLHCPVTDATRHLIGREALARMKHGAILINTARGELVDTAALLEALESGKIGGAGLDVFEGEALVREEAQLLSRAYDREQLESAIRAHQLLRRDDVIVTPHNAFNSQEAVDRILGTTMSNIEAHLEGRSQNTV
jgi:D-lactate dehydrogenase